MKKLFSQYSLKLLFGIIMTAGCLLGCFYFLSDIREKVNVSFTSYPPDFSDPVTLLSHADTYYWYARYRSNSLPEFDSAAIFAGRAIIAAEKKLNTGAIDSRSYSMIRSQAENIIELTGTQQQICRLNISSRYPFFLEIMGHEEDLMEEDVDRDEIEFLSLRGALGKLLELQIPGRPPQIGRLAMPVLVNSKTNNPVDSEFITQELNNQSSLLTVSNHNLTAILGMKNIVVDSIVKNTHSMGQIAEYFNSQELGVVEISESDKVNGIYSFTISLRYWTAQSGFSKAVLQVYHMVRDRVFNQVFGIILPVFLLFLFVAFLFNLALTTLASAFYPNNAVIAWYYMPFCFSVAMAVYVPTVWFLFKNFLNPDPGGYYATDPGEQWAALFPLSFLLLPLLVNYVVLGKLDNLVESFRSYLDRPVAIFAWIFGSLLSFPCAWTYFELIRFGYSPAVYLFIPVTGILLVLSLLISRHWAAIINFPERISIFSRVAHWLALFTMAFLVWSLISSFLTGYNMPAIIEWVTGTGLPVVLTIEIAASGISYIIKSLREDKKFSATPAPDGIAAILLKESPLGLLASSGKGFSHSMYINAPRETRGFNVFGYHLLKNRFPVRLVDFSDIPDGMKSIRYPAFAWSFGSLLPYSKFNDVAEAARRTGNLLGRLISSISSAGDLLIDERAAKPRNPSELAKTLLSLMGRECSVLFLDHIENAREEDLELLHAIILHAPGGTEYGKISKELPNFPLVVVCGYGEFGLRDRLEFILSGCGKGDYKGFQKYNLKYTNPAIKYLDEHCPDLPVQVRLRAALEMKKTGLDISPELASRLIGTIHDQGIIKPGQVFGRCSLEELVNLPDIVSGETIADGIKSKERLMAVLMAAAYVSDDLGRFRLPVIEKVLDIRKMELVLLLREAQEESLIYDLKEPEFFDWYSFTDLRLVRQFREFENPFQQELSQFGKECYDGFIRYYLSDDGEVEEVLRLMLASSELSITELTLIASRSAYTAAYRPLTAYRVLIFAGDYLSSNGNAQFKVAEELVKMAENVEKQYLRNPDLQILSFSFRLQCLDFRLRLENGKHESPETKLCLEMIKASPVYQKKTTDRTAIKLLEVKMRFLNFKPDDQTGNNLCDEIMGSDAVPLQKLRTRFYKIKLVPGSSIFEISPGWADRAAAMFTDYMGIYGELISLPANDREARELLREVLNDFAGSFLGDKLLSKFYLTVGQKPEEKQEVAEFARRTGLTDGPSLFEKIRELISARVLMESPDRKPFSGTEVLSLENLATFKSNPDPMVDKRGMCYTLNYWTRALKTMGDREAVIAVGEEAYLLNLETGDDIGCCTAAGILGDLMHELGNESSAYRWYEKSFGHGWNIKHYSRHDVLLKMEQIVVRSETGSDQSKISWYRRQLELEQLVPWFVPECIDEEIALDLLASQVAIKTRLPNLPKINAAIAQTPNQFIDSFRNWSESIPESLTKDSVFNGQWFNANGALINADAKVSNVKPPNALSFNMTFGKWSEKWEVGIYQLPEKGQWIIKSFKPCQ